MGEKIKKKEDLDIFNDLGGLVSGVNQAPEAPEQEPQPESNIVDLKASSKVERQSKRETKRVNNETTLLKFHVPKEDAQHLARIFEKMQQKLDARISLSHLARGWVTRVLTAEKELLEATEHHGQIKTPNRRDQSELSETDHVLAMIQAAAFRRAKPIK